MSLSHSKLPTCLPFVFRTPVCVYYEQESGPGSLCLGTDLRCRFFPESPVQRRGMMSERFSCPPLPR